MNRAAEYTVGRYDVDDIFDSVTQYNHQLWVAFDETKDIKGAVVTAIKQYPRKKYLDLVFIGGDDAIQWKDPMLKMLQHWAFDNECDGIESSGRMGWGRVFKDDGYKMLWQTYELPIADAGLGV
jgi:hypothetical protein